MAIPKTNLFKGDRVRLSPYYIRTYNHDTANGRPRSREELLNLRGTITTNTLNRTAQFIYVLWDGYAGPNKTDQYLPEDLLLDEEEEVVKVNAT